MPRTELIQVTFVDSETGQEFARAELAAAQLPETFEISTSLDLGGSPWVVVRADPPTAAEFVAGGSLVLTLCRIQTADPREIKYSLPTVFDPLPPTDATTRPGELFMMHDDDWRQTELVSRQLTDQVETELRAIRRIYQDHSLVVGEATSQMRVFEKIHLRQYPTAPLAPARSQRRLFELLPAVTQQYAGVGIRDMRGRAVDSFAFGIGPLTVYGQAGGDAVTVLGLKASPAAAVPELDARLAQLMREFDLLLVDWCAGEMLDASGVSGWLAATV